MDCWWGGGVLKGMAWWNVKQMVLASAPLPEAGVEQKAANTSLVAYPLEQSQYEGMRPIRNSISLAFILIWY